MKRYDKYKDSGVAWLDQVPSHWEIVPIKRLVRFQSGDSITSEAFIEDGEYPVYGANGYRGRFNHFNFDGDRILVGRVGALCGNIHHTSEKIWCSEHALISNRVVNGIPFNYRWLSQFLIFMNLNQYGAGSAQPVIASSVLENLYLSVPPLAEQEAIAAYLDEKCEAIDGMVEKIEEKIALFQRLRRAIIKKSCTEMKEYREMPLRHVFHFRNGYTPSKLVPEFWENGTIPWFRMEDIRTNGRILSDSIQHITPLAVKGELFEKNSFLLATTATIGEHAWLIADSLANQQFTNLKIRKSLGSVDYRFFFYLFFEIDEFCKETCHVSTFPSVNTDELKAFKVKIPPFAEQQAIADYLDRKCGKIDELVAKYEQQKELLARYKKALIAQVVTGQRRVCKPVFNYQTAELDNSSISMAAENNI